MLAISSSACDGRHGLVERLLLYDKKKLEERRMIERRKIRRRRYKAHTYFPAINHRGDFIMSERRQRATRRVYDVGVNDVDDVDLPTMFF